MRFLRPRCEYLQDQRVASPMGRKKQVILHATSAIAAMEAMTRRRLEFRLLVRLTNAAVAYISSANNSGTELNFVC